LALSQVTTNYWIYFYAVWLLPFAMLAFAGEHRENARELHPTPARARRDPAAELSAAG
jgi:hypothetical protein